MLSKTQRTVYGSSNKNYVEYQKLPRAKKRRVQRISTSRLEFLFEVTKMIWNRKWEGLFRTMKVINAQNGLWKNG